MPYDDDDPNVYTPDSDDADDIEAGAPTDDDDDGRWEGGYRSYRDGSYREDFRSDC